MMAADSDGCSLRTVVTCEGDLSDPRFPGQFALVLGTLQKLIGEQLKVHKLEPWNSVRVTLSIPREAALRLRQLANDGPQQLRALGILSVQVEGDQVISLRLAGPVPSETREIVLQTGQDATSGPSSSSAAPPETTSLSQLLSQGGAQHRPPEPPVASAPSDKVQFRSPNVVCPSDSIVPKVPQSNAVASPAPSSAKPYAGPFPFTSMNQAIRDNSIVAAAATASSTNQYPPNPPPPYPGNKTTTVNMTSPLLVNLLQNEGIPSPKPETETVVQSVVNGLGPTMGLNVMGPTVGPNGMLGPTVGPNGMGPTVGPPPYSHSQAKPPPPPFVQKSAPPQRANTKTIFQQTNSKVVPPSMPQKPPPPSPPVVVPPPVSLPSKQVADVESMFRPVNRPANPVASPPQQTSAKPVNTASALQQHPAVVQKPTTNNNSSNRAVPYHSSYPSFSSTTWDQPQMPQVQELCPTLPDLKTDLDLDSLLPSLEQDLVGSPPEIPEEIPDTRPSRSKYLINPLTGELEPRSSSDSEEEATPPSDVFTDLPLSASMSDEDTNSTYRPDTTDQSDSESRSCHSDGGKFKLKKSSSGGSGSREKGRDSPNLKQEKIKLRLKLEKSEPVSPAYKVDVSFINAQQPKKATSIPVEEPRVPPLHISLRGRNHAVINNKKRAKLNPDGTPAKLKVRRVKDLKVKDDLSITCPETEPVKSAFELWKSDICEVKKMKKPKSDLSVFNFKELKERRGSDSELARSTKKHAETNGILADKRRRLSQTEESQSVLGSTNVGTVSTISNHKPPKEKLKIKEGFKSKDLNRHKSYTKNLMEKLAKQVPLPTTGDMDMEAKFKQRLMEDPERIPTRIPPQKLAQSIENNEVTDLIHTLTESVEVKDKPPEADKCNTPDPKVDLIITEKQPGRSPNSGGQGEDSGIESMDALSEKSPNQASQSPHADDNLKTPKTQVPDLLDIEAQLAKMEGFTEIPERNHNDDSKEECCGPKSEVGLPREAKKENCDVKKEEDLDPIPVRVTPPLYTYSNPDKSRTESPTSDTDSNNCGGTTVKSKSLLEQLLIDIPEHVQPSSPSPAARSVRTRASSKLNSPDELSSPVLSAKRAPPTTKRKRQESDSSCNSLEETKNKKQRKCSENAVAVVVVDNPKKKASEESSDSDEPLIEYAGKVRKSGAQIANSGAQRKLKQLPNGGGGGTTNVVAGGNAVVSNKMVAVNTRRSIRAQPAVNTRSKGDKGQPDVEMIRRKTRSAVSEGEGKRRKDVK